MNNATILIKVKQRLQKQSSSDFENFPAWSILEAFNKGQVSWCRRNIHGDNILKEGDESSIARINDLEVLIKTTPALSFVDKGIYYQSTLASWPSDYMSYKRIALNAIKDCCPEPKRMTVYLGEVANVDVYLNDPNVKPDYPWNQTFATIAGHQLDIYHEDQFTIKDCNLVYYRQPVRIQILGVIDLPTKVPAIVEVECEFNDDLVELLIDETCDILAGDIENLLQMQRESNAVEKNN